jgi:hypothetical protein
MKNIILSVLFIMVFAVSAFAAPEANAGGNMTVMVGEAIRLNGSASTGYKSESQIDGTWSIRWQTGDGYDVENIIKCPHVYTAPGVYTATLTVKDASGATSISSIQVTVVNIPVATGSNVQTLTDSGNPGFACSGRGLHLLLVRFAKRRVSARTSKTFSFKRR